MKTKGITLGYFVVGWAALMGSCTQERNVEQEMDPKYTICYRAIAGTDTAWLRIDTSDRQFKGIAEFNYTQQKRRMAGPIKGTVHGDTLKGHYDFKVNNVDKWYRNPVALLKRESKLIMGVGEFNLVWGSPFFDAKIPIDYERGKFVFEALGCKIK